MTSTIRRRCAGIALLITLAVTLAACGGSEDESDESAASAIDDLPTEARLVARATGSRPFDGDAAQFLAMLPFEPLLPGISGDHRLASAMIVPSAFASGKRDELATLMLEYRGEDDEAWMQIMQQKQPMPDISGIATDTIDIGGAEAQVIRFPGSDAVQVTWHDCDLTLSISSHVIGEDEAADIGASMTEDCESSEG